MIKTKNTYCHSQKYGGRNSLYVYGKILQLYNYTYVTYTVNPLYKCMLHIQ